MPARYANSDRRIGGKSYKDRGARCAYTKVTYRWFCPLRYTDGPPQQAPVLERPDNASLLFYLQFRCVCCSFLHFVHSWMRRFRFEQQQGQQQHSAACFHFHAECRHSQGQRFGWRIASDRLSRDHRQRRLRQHGSGRCNRGARGRYRLTRLRCS